MPRGHWKAAFLESLRDTCNVRASSEAVGVDRKTVYRAREASPEFARLWDEAIEQGIQLLEFEARRRALHGTEKPVFYEGEVCGHVREYSDTLMVTLLKAHRPKVYRERYEVDATHSGSIAFVDKLKQAYGRRRDPQPPDES